ncbi:hypothetical protein [Streptomyces pseudovenezuelae]|uniref:hypothetical protein n=1 Tax=Streptomyces pseudovenezuelae TaxID=67350 RepID=UPI002E818084|nr:hypothetical protein [Streptomyces pseudovenezuelae]WUA94534.1 hypothetical protein OHO81_44985 [Streptomyces pseudovenezuelae]
MLTTPAPANTQPAMCLLHGDFHTMEQACWAATTDWYFNHQTMDEHGDRHAYLAAVERRMLDNLLETLR